MPIWKFDDFANIVDNAKRIIPKVNDKVSISVDKKFLYINDTAMPTGPGMTGMIMQCGDDARLSWVDPGQLGTGQTGPQGATGAFIIGATGLMGSTGRDGAFVAQGVTGVQGTTGLIGETGLGAVGGLTGCLNLTIDGRGYPITTGYKGDIVVPFNITLHRWDMFGDTGGSATVNVKKATYTSYPTATGMYIGSSAPSISLAVKAQDTNISDWNNRTASSADIIRIEVASCTGMHRLSINLGYSAT
jgi:hypothetical protein